MAISIRLDWVAPVGSVVSFYNVYRATSISGPFTVIGSSSTTEFVDSGITEGVTYYYEITAVNAAGESSPSSETSSVNTFFEISAQLTGAATTNGVLSSRNNSLITGHTAVSATLKGKGILLTGVSPHATVTAKLHKLGDVLASFAGTASVGATAKAAATSSSAISGAASVRLNVSSNPITHGRFSEVLLEAMVANTAAKCRVSDVLVETETSNTQQNARISQAYVEVMYPSAAVATPTGTGTPSQNIWLVYVDSVDAADAGRQSLVIKLADNQNIVYNPASPWYSTWVYSALMSCSYPNVIQYGGRVNWNFSTVTAGLIFSFKVGVVFYDKDLNYISEYTTDYPNTTQDAALATNQAAGNPAPYNSWGNIPVSGNFSTAAVPANASFFRYECVALVSAASATIGTGIGQNNATFMFDDLFAVQTAAGSTGVATGAAPSIPPGQVIVNGNLAYTSTFASAQFEDTTVWSTVGVSILFSDGTSIAIPDGVVATAVNLPVSTVGFYYYPYYDLISGTVQFVPGPWGPPTLTTGPGQAFSGPGGSAPLLVQSSSTHVPLSVGPIVAATTTLNGPPVSGTGGGGVVIS